MKTITIDFDTYQQELVERGDYDARNALDKLLAVLMGQREFEQAFYADSDSYWAKRDAKMIAAKIVALFDSKKEKLD